MRVVFASKAEMERFYKDASDNGMTPAQWFAHLARTQK